MQKKYLLFDLDGTLTDSKLGITRCVQYALKSLGIDEPDLDKLECYIGPPLIDSFQRYHGLSLEQAQIGVAKYRERFRDTGIFENEVIAGIPEVLEELKKRGYVMALATSKPEEFALRITKHFNLSQYFEIEVGSGMNGELKYKADVIAEIENSNFNPDVISACISQAQSAGYTLQVSGYVYDADHDIQSAEVIVSYSYEMPLLGISKTQSTRGIAR